MKRRLIQLCVFLVLGAAVTFGVSWWCGWRILFDQRESLSIGSRPTKNAVLGNEAGHVDSAVFYLIRVERQPGAATVNIRALLPGDFSGDFVLSKDANVFDQLWMRWGAWPTSWGPPRLLVATPPEEFLRRQPYKTDYSIAARGWPMLATWCELNTNDPGGIPLGLGVVPGTFFSTERVLPLRPIWWGFMVDTALYAFVIRMIWHGPCMLRTWARRRANRCIHCGYPVGISPACTECGNPVTPRST